MSFDNTNPGDLAEHHVSQNFVNNVNIVAVHSRNWAAYKYLQIDITYKGKTGRFIVMDYCSDDGCSGCCSHNAAYNSNNFLTDVDASAAQRIWGWVSAEDSLKDSATFKVVSNNKVNVDALIAQYP
jgi:hypothetical protein